MNLQAIVWDMDGVIVDTEAQHARAEQDACHEFGIVAPRAEWARFKGMRSHEMFALIVEHFAAQPVSVDALVGRSRANFLDLIAAKLTPLPGALECLRAVRVLGLKIGLATSSGREIQERIFDRLGLHPYFDATVTGDDITEGNPTLSRISRPPPVLAFRPPSAA